MNVNIGDVFVDFSTPIIARVYSCASIAARNMNHFPKKPAKGGMPAIENIKTNKANAIIG